MAIWQFELHRVHSGGSNSLVYVMAVVHVVHHAALGDRYKQAGTKSIDEADHVMSYLPVC